MKKVEGRFAGALVSVLVPLGGLLAMAAVNFVLSAFAALICGGHVLSQSEKATYLGMFFAGLKNPAIASSFLGGFFMFFPGLFVFGIIGIFYFVKGRLTGGIYNAIRRFLFIFGVATVIFGYGYAAGSEAFFQLSLSTAFNASREFNLAIIAVNLIVLVFFLYGFYQLSLYFLCSLLAPPKKADKT